LDLAGLRGKVVLVNFWGAWCLPCVNEISTLNALQRRFQNEGLMILAISDDDATTLHRFLAGHRVTYPALLDAGRKVTESFHMVGIPRTLIYDRSGILVPQTNASRTTQQFVEMLGQAGLH
jgi:peroxiredoxin